MVKRALAPTGLAQKGRSGALTSDDFLPPLESAVFEISEAEIRALFTTPVTLIAARTGYSHVPERSVWYREIGTAYTLGASTNIILTPNGSQVLDGASVSTFLGTATEETIYMPYIGLGTSGTFTTLSQINLRSNGLLSNPLTLAIQGGNVSGGTGKIFISLMWRTFKMGKL